MDDHARAREVRIIELCNSLVAETDNDMVWTWARELGDVLKTHNHQLQQSLGLQQAPKVAEFFLLLLPIRDREHLLGDLEEEFRTILVPKYGIKIASVLYTWQVAIEFFHAIRTGLFAVAFGWLLRKFSK